jgi:hypothetical protein
MIQRRMTYTDLLRWYRTEWQAELGSGRIHVQATDPGGDPDWHQRFRDLMAFTESDAGNDDIQSMRRFPLRWALRSMSRGGRRGHRRARFLFVLACQDFDVHAAARAISPAGYDEHGGDWAVSYAVYSLEQLHRLATDVSRTHEDGKPRTFVQRRIGKSEAQAMAEAT